MDTFLPELKTQQARTQALIDERRHAFAARTGQQLGEDNVWLSGRRQEQDALGRVIATLETVAPAEGGGTRAVRGAGVPASTDVVLVRLANGPCSQSKYSCRGASLLAFREPGRHFLCKLHLHLQLGDRGLVVLEFGAQPDQLKPLGPGQLRVRRNLLPLRISRLLHPFT